MGDGVGYCQCPSKETNNQNSPFKNVPEKLIARFRKQYKWTAVALTATISLFILSAIFCFIYPCRFFMLAGATLFWAVFAVEYIHGFFERRSVKKLMSYLDKPSNELTDDEQCKIHEELNKIFSIFHRRQKEAADGK